MQVRCVDREATAVRREASDQGAFSGLNVLIRVQVLLLVGANRNQHDVGVCVWDL